MTLALCITRTGDQTAQSGRTEALACKPLSLGLTPDSLRHLELHVLCTVPGPVTGRLPALQPPPLRAPRGP